ncbi:MAG: hypothetical protein DI538_00180 [Azospira oryzae]|jgi:hypothetical protein|nr:MAG: hypothetical protein DI538_00180 [Azospira oryzae]
MNNLLAGVLVPVVIGISILLSLYAKKKKPTRQSASIEVKMTTSKKYPVAPRHTERSSSGITISKPSLQIRIPKLMN